MRMAKARIKHDQGLGDRNPGGFRRSTAMTGIKVKKDRVAKSTTIKEGCGDKRHSITYRKGKTKSWQDSR